MPSYIPVSTPAITPEDVAAVSRTLEAGWVSGDSPVVREFEQLFAESLNRGHGVAVSSGTAALDVTFAALGIGLGDEIIVPTFSIISCVLQVVRSGATPVLVDASPADWNVQIPPLIDAITDRTKAVLAVHTYGLPVDMDPLIEVCAENGIALIEDAAEAHGLAYKDRLCGSMGLAGTFSFYSNKTMTTGEGGMVVTDDPLLAEKLRGLRNLNFKSDERFVHEQLGWNMRMSSLQAALGISQLKRLNASVDRKRQIGDYYRERLGSLPDVQVAPGQTDHARNSYWVFGMVLGNSYPAAREVRHALEDRGVGTRPFFCPMHLQPVFLDRGLFREAYFPVAENLWERGLYLPSGLELTTEELEFVCTSVEDVLS